jgi:UDP-N-acetylglucosamine:LPS N-acetylglucosamine transferase
MNNKGHKSQSRILLISSGGGHWIQLMLIRNSFINKEIIYGSTLKKSPLKNQSDSYVYFPDFSSWNKIKMIFYFPLYGLKILNISPEIIISTGAAPGLFCIIWGRIFGKKTIWIDSLANIDTISKSGKIAKRFAQYHLTQWAHLANNETMFKGSCIDFCDSGKPISL